MANFDPYLVLLKLLESVPTNANDFISCVLMTCKIHIFFNSTITEAVADKIRRQKLKNTQDIITTKVFH